MCLITFAYKTHEEYPIIFTANRDEFYHRATDQMHWWPRQNILAGKDLKAGGTWFGTDLKGRWGAITNYRDLDLHKEDALSRGKIIPQFLNGADKSNAFLEKIKSKSNKFNPFNVLLFDGKGLFYFNNVEQEIQEVEPGVHTLSNAFLNTPWPKTQKVKSKFEQMINVGEIEIESLLELLYDTEKANNEALPDTGVGIEMEKMLSPIFIQSPQYGTRCSTVMRLDNKGLLEVFEKTYVPAVETPIQQFRYRI